MAENEHQFKTFKLLILPSFEAATPDVFNTSMIFDRKKLVYGQGPIACTLDALSLWVSTGRCPYFSNYCQNSLYLTNSYKRMHV